MRLSSLIHMSKSPRLTVISHPKVLSPRHYYHQHHLLPTDHHLQHHYPPHHITPTTIIPATIISLHQATSISFDMDVSSLQLSSLQLSSLQLSSLRCRPFTH